MDRAALERQFTSMLVHLGIYRAYINFTKLYLTTDKDYIIVKPTEQSNKLYQLRLGEPRLWISSIFSEGLDITPAFAKADNLWKKHLEEIRWPQN